MNRIGLVLVGLLLSFSISFAQTAEDFRYIPRAGFVVDCPSEDALKEDFLKQLHRHAIYGGIQEMSSNGPKGPTFAEKMTYYRGNLPIKSNLFTELQKDDLYDGANVLTDATARPEVGDILLNLEFYNPVNHGKFFAKRAMIHARMVVAVEDDAIVVLDSGWESFSRLRQIHSQTVWLKPKKEFINEATGTTPSDRELITLWAEAIEPVKYDNLLVDDLARFRSALHKGIDDRMATGQYTLAEATAEARRVMMARSRGAQLRAPHLPWGDPTGGHRAVSLAIEAAIAKKVAQGLPGVLTLEEESAAKLRAKPLGLYCSEGPTAIYSYLGFRLYGATAFDIVTAFSPKGDLPKWDDYGNALHGFGAGAGTSVYMMHKLIHGYFKVLDTARRINVIDLPRLAGEDASIDLVEEAMTFADFTKANRDRALNIGFQDVDPATGLPTRDILREQLETIAALALEDDHLLSEIGVGATQILHEFTKPKAEGGVLESMSATLGEPLNLTTMINSMFFENLAYGPHHFMENSSYFDLHGVYYNTDLRGGYQAKWIVDYDTNNSTTLYRINPSAVVPADHDLACVMTDEELPFMSTQR